MKTSDARLIISAIAKAVKQRFVRREEHDELVRRVEKLEQQLAALKEAA